MKQNLKYTKTHEWVLIEQNIATVGITDFAQTQMGDIVFVDLPKKGTKVEKGKQACVVESVKSAFDIYSPLTGEVIEVNENLTSEPAVMNQDPYGNGWIFKIKISNIDTSDLMDNNQYEEFVKTQQH
ncbi:MAG: glycine cleavage system protein GcvH [Elusimicrobiales bacterium]|nr:glycine cleavage system protein GcvH [Elusimicrobiales bacterium]